MSRAYLTEDDVLFIHEALIGRFGGAAGVRDPFLLGSAVLRPRNGYYDGAVQEACALLESLLVNHPFADGNKRTAFAACDVFLRLNGVTLRAPDETLYAAVIRWLETPASARWEMMERDLRAFAG